MISALQRELKVFLLNFAETGYEEDTWPIEYAHFALEWSKVNDPSKVSIIPAGMIFTVWSLGYTV